MSAWLERYRSPLTLILLCACFVGIAVWWERRPAPSNLVVSSPTPSPADRQRWLVVDVGGAVNQPGIYYLPEGARIADAVSEAGGTTGDADLARLNRAVKLRDEQQVRVPYLPTTSQDTSALAPTASPATPARPREGAPAVTLVVNINTASLAQLDTLPGIGPVTAQRIISYREQTGFFKRIEELKEAKLVNMSTFEKIKHLIEAN